MHFIFFNGRCSRIIVTRQAGIRSHTTRQNNVATDSLKLIKYSGSVPDTTRSEFNIPVSHAVNTTMPVVFSIYSNEKSQNPIWTETQLVNIDSTGRYSVLLGNTNPNGVPLEIFAEGEARWLGTKLPNGDEQRVALVSVPYALKAQDATTLQGHGFGEFMMKNDSPTVGGKRDREIPQTLTTGLGERPIK